MQVELGGGCSIPPGPQVRKTGEKQEFGFEQLHLNNLLAFPQKLSSRQLDM